MRHVKGPTAAPHVSQTCTQTSLAQSQNNWLDGKSLVFLFGDKDQSLERFQHTRYRNDSPTSV